MNNKSSFTVQCIEKKEETIDKNIIMDCCECECVCVRLFSIW